MVKYLFLLLTLSVFSKVNAQQNTDLLSIPGPIDYAGTELFLSWSKPVSKTLFRQQYMPRDEQIENYNQLLDFSFFNKEIEMELAVRQKVEMIQKREDSDKYAKVSVTESPDGTEFIVDYFLSESPKNGSPFIEYNVDRFKSYNNGTNKSFLILSYSKREYGDLKSAAKSLAKQRDRLLVNLIEYKIPEIKVQN